MGAARDRPATAALRHPGPASPGHGRSQHADDLAITPNMADGGLAARGPATTKPVSTRRGGPTVLSAGLVKQAAPTGDGYHDISWKLTHDNYELAAFAGQLGLRRPGQRSQASAPTAGPG
jgi:hypothetical protein